MKIVGVLPAINHLTFTCLKFDFSKHLTDFGTDKQLDASTILASVHHETFFHVGRHLSELFWDFGKPLKKNGSNVIRSKISSWNDLYDCEKNNFV